jgi:hypothetical protein
MLLLPLRKLLLKRMRTTLVSKVLALYLAEL